LYIVDISDLTESPQGTSKKIKKVNLSAPNTSVALKQEFIYAGSSDFTLTTGAKVSAVAWNGIIMRLADWTQTVNTLTINFTPTTGDVFTPIGII
jgi:hypothetical protein